MTRNKFVSCHEKLAIIFRVTQGISVVPRNNHENGIEIVVPRNKKFVPRGVRRKVVRGGIRGTNSLREPGPNTGVLKLRTPPSTKDRKI